ncbi:MAG: DNA starvation/stationary phase protection protein Dps [Verrucomicrobiota bacterium]
MKKDKNALADPPTMYPTGIDLPLNERIELNTLINLRLASAIDLQLQLKQAHWNVKGPCFIGLHELFDSIAAAVESYVDMIAERVVQLGGTAEGTVRVAASRSRLDEYPRRIRHREPRHGPQSRRRFGRHERPTTAGGFQGRLGGGQTRTCGET